MKIINKILILALVISVCTLAMCAAAVDTQKPTITTDKSDYSPTDSVYITGSGFAPNANVELTLSGPSAFTEYSWTVVSDENGNFQTNYAGGLMAGNFVLIATDGANMATTTFTDFSLYDFYVDPPSYAFIGPGSKTFNVTAVLPGNCGSNGVDVYLTPEAGQLAQGVTLSYASNPLHIQPNQGSGSTTMTITVDSTAMNGSVPLVVGAYDNPGTGGSIQLGSFNITLHINQYFLDIVSKYDYAYPTSGWYNQGTEVTFGVTTTVAQDSGTQYNFNGWVSGDSGGYSGADISHTIVVNNNITETAKWVAGLYQVKFQQTGSALTPTVTYQYVSNGETLQGTATVPFNVWVDPGSMITFAYDTTLVGGPQTRYILMSTNATSPWTVTGPTTITGTYQTFYLVHYAITGNQNYISVPSDEWVASGSTPATTFPSVVTVGGVRDTLVNVNPPLSQPIVSPITITATYQTSYYVILVVSPSGAGSISPSGSSIWANKGPLAITATSNPGYHFNSWSSNTPSITFENSISASTTATINGPGTITANFGFNPAKYFMVSAPTSAVAGNPFSITVTAYDEYGNVAVGYSGTVQFTSSDQDSLVSLPSNYAFQLSDHGSKVFINAVILITAGPQTITVTDISDNSITGTSQPINVIANIEAPGYLTVSPAEASINAGETQTFTAELFDAYGNSLGDVTSTVTWSIDAAAGGSWDQAYGAYTSAIASPVGSPWTVTATLDTLSATASLTVTHATDVAYLDYITASIEPATVEAPNTATGTATAYDTFGNSWDISTEATWSIPAGGDGGTWVVNVYTSNTAGTYEVQAEYEGKSATTYLTVTHSTDVAYLDYITASTEPATVEAPNTATGTATAYDTFGNSWDISTEATWSIPAGGDGGTWVVNVYTSNTAGTYEVQAEYEGKTATTTLTVTHATDIAYLDYITASVNPTTVAAPNIVIGTATAYDTFGNSWDISTEASWSIPAGGDGGTWSENIYTSNKAGTYIVQAEYEGKTATASLTVTHATDTGLLAGLSISPPVSTITAGGTQSYVATATDTLGNSWDVTAEVSAAKDWIITAAAGGSWNGNVYTAAKAGTWTVTGSYLSKTATASLTVNPAGVSSFVFSTIASPQIAGLPFTITITAKDVFGNTVTSYTGSNSLSESTGTITPNSTTAFFGGVWSGKVTITKPGTEVTITTSDTSNHKGTSNSFAVNQYKISASAGPNGAINPSGDIFVNYGGNQTFTITANGGYHINSITINGTAVSNANSVTVSNVTGDTTISATFAANPEIVTPAAATAQYNIIVVQHDNGTISPGTVKVDAGSSQTFTITPDVGFQISDVIVDGVSKGTPNTYTFTNIQTSHTLTAYFAIQNFTITVSAGPNGTIEPSGILTVSYGSDASFAIIADNGYHIDDVQVDGTSVGNITNYQFNSVNKDHTLTATFAIDENPQPAFSLYWILLIIIILIIVTIILLYVRRRRKQKQAQNTAPAK